MVPTGTTLHPLSAAEERQSPDPKGSSGNQSRRMRPRKGSPPDHEAKATAPKSAAKTRAMSASPTRSMIGRLGGSALPGVGPVRFRRSARIGPDKVGLGTDRTRRSKDRRT